MNKTSGVHHHNSLVHVSFIINTASGQIAGPTKCVGPSPVIAGPLTDYSEVRTKAESALSIANYYFL